MANRAVESPQGINPSADLRFCTSSGLFKPVGWAKSSLARSDSASKGGKTGEKERGLRGRPRLKGLEVERYAALAFLTAVGFAGFGWAFAVVFLAACVLSFAANSALTFWAMASVSTL